MCWGVTKSWFAQREVVTYALRFQRLAWRGGNGGRRFRVARRSEQAEFPRSFRDTGQNEPPIVQPPGMTVMPSDGVCLELQNKFSPQIRRFPR